MDRNKRQFASLSYDDLSYDEPVLQPAKRPKPERSSKANSQPRVDPTYGQRSAFPGLDSYSAYVDNDDDDLEYGDDIEALQYLQAVRDEASGIPTLLVTPKPARPEHRAPDRSIYEDGLGDTRGFYSEGAYVGAPHDTPESHLKPEILASRSPRHLYFESLLQRFKKLHDQLAQIPPRSAVEALSSNHPSHMSSSRDDLKKWRSRIFHTDPMPAQLARMDKFTVFKILRLILTHSGMLGGKQVISRRLSRWIWGLLAKVPASGELTSEEVGAIRELGKRAVWMGVEMRGVDIRELYREDDEQGDDEVVLDFEFDGEQEEMVEGANNSPPLIGPILPAAVDISTETGQMPANNADISMEVTEQVLVTEVVCGESSKPNEQENGNADEVDEEARIAAMKARLLSSLDENAVAGAYGEDDSQATIEAERRRGADLENAKVVVDMIITIAGEIYGQRDLLEFREEWV